MTLDLNAIKQRADAATEGPWEVVTSNLSAGGFDYEGYFIPDYLDVVSDYYIGEVAPFDTLEDAVFVAHAHGDITALVAEVERLRGIVDEVTARRDEWAQALENAHHLVLLEEIIDATTDALEGP